MKWKTQKAQHRAARTGVAIKKASSTSQIGKLLLSFTYIVSYMHDIIGVIIKVRRIEELCFLPAWKLI